MDRERVSTPCNFVICLDTTVYIRMCICMSARERCRCDWGKAGCVRYVLSCIDGQCLRSGVAVPSASPSPALRRPQVPVFMRRLCTANLISHEWIVYQS